MCVILAEGPVFTTESKERETQERACEVQQESTPVVSASSRVAVLGRRFWKAGQGLCWDTVILHFLVWVLVA